ncbi:glycosyl hydrolase family 38 protein [Anopheles sinensis]|uniref:Glycosyl hydrolase family 38 protein n=1 Tax=Anopheles sinensis TaxID=74873 RepID=A0A084WDW6_ANOSI|nr:glycosyl hydrolase family 38 protein [Anopheles sinensis]
MFQHYSIQHRVGPRKPPLGRSGSPPRGGAKSECARPIEAGAEKPERVTEWNSELVHRLHRRTETSPTGVTRGEWRIPPVHGAYDETDDAVRAPECIIPNQNSINEGKLSPACYHAAPSP